MDINRFPGQFLVKSKELPSVLNKHATIDRRQGDLHTQTLISELSQHRICRRRLLIEMQLEEIAPPASCLHAPSPLRTLLKSVYGTDAPRALDQDEVWPVSQ
jgi:hypothetical protein